MEQLAQTAMDAVSDGRVKIIPERYAKSYLDWLGEKRDWPISRQLWWGHQIPIWYCKTASEAELQAGVRRPRRRGLASRRAVRPVADLRRGGRPADESAVPGHTLVREQDVLDTWFSSALWPHSTLGWPEQTPELAYYYPTSVLITSRDIITLWVARMVITGLYNVGEVPFHDVFIHPKILDGYGEGMSKSKGNGVDPLDVIEKFGADALRFGLAYLTTETQDIRMPVEFECPHCQKLIEQTKENRVRPRIKCKQCGKEFSTQWAEKPADKALPRGAVVSERFELARNFCNKLWNASRFALMNLEGYTPGAVADADLLVEDRWILSRLATVTREVTTPPWPSIAMPTRRGCLYGFAWDEFCSFYVEMVKARLSDAAAAADGPAGAGPHARHAVAAAAPDDSVRDRGGVAVLAEAAPRARHRSHPLPPGPAGKASGWLAALAAESIMIAPWPQADAARQDAEIEARFARFQEVLRAVRDIRGRQNVPPRKQIDFAVRCDAATAELLRPMEPYFVSMAARGDRLGPGGRCAETFGQRGLGRHGGLRRPGRPDRRGAEVERKQQEMVRLEGLIAAKRKKLENANFVERAPAAVVEGERAALKDLEDQHAAAKRWSSG